MDFTRTPSRCPPYARTPRASRLDRQAAIELYSSHVHLAHHLAHRHEARAAALHIASDDLHQEALVALWRATQRFDPARGCKFITLANLVIRQQLERFLTLAGALTGAGLGGLVGLGVLAGVIPVFGPAIAAGTLGILLSNAAAGATLAGVAGALVGMGIPEDEAHHYGGEFLAGRYIVTVMTGGRTEEAPVVLRRCGAVERATGAVTA